MFLPKAWNLSMVEFESRDGCVDRVESSRDHVPEAGEASLGRCYAVGFASETIDGPNAKPLLGARVSPPTNITSIFKFAINTQNSHVWASISHFLFVVTRSFTSTMIAKARKSRSCQECILETPSASMQVS
jgi:hypothetical protein